MGQREGRGRAQRRPEVRECGRACECTTCRTFHNRNPDRHLMERFSKSICYQNEQESRYLHKIACLWFRSQVAWALGNQDALPQGRLSCFFPAPSICMQVRRKTRNRPYRRETNLKASARHTKKARASVRLPLLCFPHTAGRR